MTPSDKGWKEFYMGLSPMKKYEFMREHGWRVLYNSDIMFKYDPKLPPEEQDIPNAKVNSYFIKSVRTTAKEIDDNLKKEVDYEIKVSVEWFEYCLKHKLRYKKTWYGEPDKYNFIAMQNYLDQCLDGGFKNCILSKQEYMSIKPKTKRVGEY